MSAKKGIDVSFWQGVIDWDKVKAAGIEFAMIRAGHGTGNIDQQFHRNISECNRLNIPCGVYWFSYAYTEDMAAQEARDCIAACKGFRLAYPVAFDWEYESADSAKRHGVTVGKNLASAMARAFLREVKSAGYKPMLYANPDFLARYYDQEIPKEFPVWLAKWPGGQPSPEPQPEGAAIWQWGIGRVDGIKGDVDMDYGYVDYGADSDAKNEGETISEMIEAATAALERAKDAISDAESILGHLK